MSSPTVALAVIAKDEASVIGRCIDSAASCVSKVVLHVDSKTEDDTLGVAAERCVAHGLELLAVPFQFNGFGVARSYLLQAGRDSGCDFTLTLDADEVLTGPIDLRGHGDADGYKLCMVLAGDWEVWRTYLFSNRQPWRFQGDLHEVSVLDGGGETPKLRGVDVVNLGDGKSGAMPREQVLARYAREAIHLHDQLTANPGDTRAAYYLAQSLHDSCQGEAAIAAYENRAAMAGGFQEERYLSLLMIARWRKHLRQHPSRVLSAYLAAVHFRPERNEARVELARMLNDLDIQDNPHAAAARDVEETSDLFLVQRSAYTWAPWVEHARHLMRRGSHLAREAWECALTFPNLPLADRQGIEHHLAQ